MTSVKPRHPLSWSGAIDRLVGRLGAAACADLVGKSESLVRKWADPDCPELPSVDQALRLDAGWLAAGNVGAPFAEVHAARLQMALGATSRASPLERLADVVMEVGDVAGAVRTAGADGAITGTERAAIGREAQEAIEALLRLVRDLGGMP